MLLSFSDVRKNKFSKVLFRKVLEGFLEDFSKFIPLGNPIHSFFSSFAITSQFRDIKEFASSFPSIMRHLIDSPWVVYW